MMPYKLSDLIKEAGLAKTKPKALKLVPQVLVNGHETGGMADPLVIPDADGRITLTLDGKDTVLEDK